MNLLHPVLGQHVASLPPCGCNGIFRRFRNTIVWEYEGNRLRIILPRLPDLQVNQLGMSRNTQGDSALKVVPCRAFQTTSFGVILV